MQKAIVVASKGVLAVQDIPKPTPAPDQVLVRVHAAGLNPMNWRVVDGIIPGWNAVGQGLGVEAAGTVEGTGARVATMATDMENPLNRSLAEYVAVDEKLLIQLPETVSFDHGAAIAVGAITACQMLYQTLKVPRADAPTAQAFPVLVWGAGSITGQFAVQLAALAGLDVIAVASLKHTAFLKSLGASHVLDYADPATPSNILALTGGKLKHIAAAMVGPDARLTIAECFGDEGGVVSVINHGGPTDARDGKVQFVFSTGFTLTGKALESPIKIPAVPEHYVAAQGYVKLISKLLAEGKLRPPPIRVFEGLERTAEGLDELRQGRASGEKIVVSVA